MILSYQYSTPLLHPVIVPKIPLNIKVLMGGMSLDA